MNLHKSRSERFGEVHTPGHAGSADLTEAVAEQGDRLDALRLPQARQRDLDDEQGRQLQRRQLEATLVFLRQGLAAEEP